MQPFSNDPASAGNPPPAPPWAGQQGNFQASGQLGNPLPAPPWAGQQGNPPPAPPWAGQQGNPQASGQPAPPQAAPAWAGQSNALPFGIQATLLDRGSAWPALQLISRGLKIIAWIELVFGVILSLVVGVTVGGLGAALAGAAGGGGGGGTGFLGFMITIFYLVGTAITFLGTYGSAELILVFLAIEKNTRKDE